MVRPLPCSLVLLLGSASAAPCSELQVAYSNFLKASFTLTRSAQLTVDGKTAFRQITALKVKGSNVSSRTLSREENGASVNFKDVEPFPPAFTCAEIRQINGNLYQVTKSIEDLKGGKQVATFNYLPDRRVLIPVEITETGVASVLFFRKNIHFKVDFGELQFAD